jgi:hypothetical protein
LVSEIGFYGWRTIPDDLRGLARLPNDSGGHLSHGAATGWLDGPGTAAFFRLVRVAGAKKAADPTRMPTLKNR